MALCVDLSPLLVLLTYLLNSLIGWTRDLRCCSIPRAELTATLISLLLPDTATLKEITLPDNNNGISTVFFY